MLNILRLGALKMQSISPQWWQVREQWAWRLIIR